MGNIHNAINIIVIYVAAFVHYGLQLLDTGAETILTYMNIGVGATVIILSIVQIYYKIKNKGK